MCCVFKALLVLCIPPCFELLLGGEQVLKMEVTNSSVSDVLHRARQLSHWIEDDILRRTS